MKQLLSLSYTDAKSHFLKGSSYFNGDFPGYIGFEPILEAVAVVLDGGDYKKHQSKKPASQDGVNYSFISNKDGRFGWRPIELMHPAVYVSLVNLICEERNWATIQRRFSDFGKGVVECCSLPVVSTNHQTDQASQVSSWWQQVEQQSFKLSLDYTHTLHTDVTDCYGSIYTHSIAWALHGVEEAKAKPNDLALLGNGIDKLIQASRYGQTNGISQGSVLMDFVAELVLGYIDEEITKESASFREFRILRYRDDYRIFADSDVEAEKILKLVSDKLRLVGMRLGVGKTFMSRNIVEGSIKPDKLSGIELQDLGKSNAKTLQKQLLRLHAFGMRYPNSGALRRLLSELHKKLVGQSHAPDDLEVQVAIATDIAVVSPIAFPAIAGILSHLISLAEQKDKTYLWNRVRKKMKRIPYNGYLEIWLQRVTVPSTVDVAYESEEPICQLVSGGEVELWNNSWVGSKALKAALDVQSIVVGDLKSFAEVVTPGEVQLFAEQAQMY